MEYRRGNFEKAAGWCQQSLNYPEHIAPRTATARIILAMSDQKLGKTNEARSELAEAREIIENKFKNPLDLGTPMQGFWFDWLFARILLDEATALVEGSPKNLKFIEVLADFQRQHIFCRVLQVKGALESKPFYD